MKVRYCLLVALAGVVAGGLWWHYRTLKPTVLSFGLGDTFEEVAKNSSYPVIEQSNRPADDPGENKFGATWVSEPAVIIHFTDPKHGFTLPPTKFAALTYSDNKAVSLATSPMLDNLPFDEAVAVLEYLQKQFKAGGWEPYKGDGSDWFDLTPKGKKRLYARMFEPGYAQEATLRIPKKYGMTFRLKCAEGCWAREPPYKFLIDVGVGVDTEGWEPGREPFPEP
jgi:hypothetical protein